MRDKIEPLQADIEAGVTELVDGEEPWAWAVIEVLRHTGIRVEELLELTHCSVVAYTLPTSGRGRTC